MLRLLSLLLIVCALVGPRAAWGAHLAGHEELTSGTAVHTHHGDHAHEHAAPAPEHEAALDAEPDEDGALTHDHGSADALVSAMLLPNVSANFPDVPTIAGVLFDRARNFGALKHPESLLRPPRLA